MKSTQSRLHAKARGCRRDGAKSEQRAAAAEAELLLKREALAPQKRSWRLSGSNMTGAAKLGREQELQSQPAELATHQMR